MNTVYTTTGSVLLTLALGAAAPAQTIEVPGYSIFNFLPVPEGVPIWCGDIIFDAGGQLAYFLGDSESSGSGVWTAPVNRDPDGNVLSFGPATELFLEPDLDTGLAMAPDGSGTFFCMAYYAIVQRLADGTVEYIEDISENTYGGLAFIPKAYTLSGRLLRSAYDYNLIYSYTATPDGDGSYTLGGEQVYADLSKDAVGDIEFVQTGPLANTLIMADYDNNSIIYIDVDPTTGLPAGGISPSTSLFVSGYDSAWGLAIDPVTGNIWATPYGSGQLMQIIATCPADFDGDGTVGASDLAQLLGSWGPCPGCPADLDNDGDVDAADLAQLLGSWGPCS